MTTGLAKAAKVLTAPQIKQLLRFTETTAYPKRNRVMVLLSFKAALRAKEIGMLTWAMVTDAEGALVTSMSLTNGATKGKSGRVIPLNTELFAALDALHQDESAKQRTSPDGFVITMKKGSTDAITRANSVVCLFKDWYARLGFKGASSHSGRRTAITNLARNVSRVGGSLRAVQVLAGHASIVVTQRYVDTDPDAQRKLVELI